MDGCNNYKLIINISFISKLVERAVANHRQELLEETDALDPFQSEFRPHNDMETTLFALHNDPFEGG